MYFSNIAFNNTYKLNSPNTTETNTKPVSNAGVQNPIEKPSFKGAPEQQRPILIASSHQPIRTQLSTKEEQEKFVKLATVLEPKDRQKLAFLLQSGILLNNNSNDQSSTLDNLYKIATTPRVEGLTPSKILSETVNTIANPFIITQNFGNVPKSYSDQIVAQAKPNPKTPDDQINPNSIDVKNSSDCVSASIEFILAKQMPAEFTRFAEGLTSPNMSVDKTIKLGSLTDNNKDSIYLLDAFEIPYQKIGEDKAKLTLAPDKNSFIRAQIQNNDKDNLERSLIDVLMQSTFMNVGSQGTYDSLTDIRGGKFNNDNKGLIEIEKTFTESIVQDKNKMSVTYQNLDENAKLIGYNTDFESIAKNIIDSLAIGENVIIGYTQLDKNKQVINGHEITIIGATTDKKGDLIFICNDTDDDNPNPITYPASYIIPKIHHAGLPLEVVQKDPKTQALVNKQ